ncbi:MAG TPA: ATP-binding cassette domain-containing protein [Geminicoccaceae bacterium]|nr:ATP-binding cassette domain-containing protein [Geminicoccus sp.]HMU49574.1 ATP-binding cassette domain-containing protein [Geminicoccaceae bacterium]
MAGPAAAVLELRGAAGVAADGSLFTSVDQRLAAGEVVCILGDPAGGARALMGFLAGQTRLVSGSIAVPAARPGRWTAAAAMQAGIGVAAGDVLLPRLPIWRSFVLAGEPAFGLPPFRLLRRGRARDIAREALARIGAASIDPDRLPEELGPAERRLVGVARAFWIGSRAVLLDEPTRGLGVDETTDVLHRILEARQSGVAVLFATSDVQHAWAVADRFMVLYGGRPLGSFLKGQTSREELYRLMLGNQDFRELAHELVGRGWQQLEPPPPPPPRQRPAPPPPPQPQRPEAAPAAEPPTQAAPDPATEEPPGDEAPQPTATPLSR